MNFAQGLSAAGYGAGELYAKQSLIDAQLKADLVKDEVAGQRAQRLAEFKANLDANMADKARTEQVKRIDEKTGALADAQLAPKYGDISARSPDQQDRLTSTRAEERSGLIDAPALRTKAAIATGDISPKDAATIEREDRRIDAAEKMAALKERLETLREDGRNARAERTAEMQQKRMEVMLELGQRRLEQMGKKADQAATVKEALSFVDGQRKELASEAQNVRQLYQSELKAAKLPDDKARVESEYKPKLAAIEQKRAMIEQDYSALRERVGLPARSEAAPPKPAAAPASAATGPKADAKPETKPAPVIKALPPGARQIGTSGGKPVYETPDGKRFIAQ